jgi:hypothetical protein
MPRRALIVVAVLAVLASCGTGSELRVDATATPTAAGATAGASPEQPAVWPSAGVVFGSPEAVAEDFVSQVLGVPPTLGDFRQGDARSGEIDVFSPGEGVDPTPVFRSTLLLRQLGADDGWFVVGAVNENVSITVPDSGEEIAAGPLTVEGLARGFEANVVVEAFVAGDAALLAQQITTGGALETPEPYIVTLDLSAAAPGQVVALLVRGGTGLGTDPGEFSAIPVVVAGEPMPDVPPPPPPRPVPAFTG